MNKHDMQSWPNEAEILRRAQLARAHAVDAWFARLAQKIRRRSSRPAPANLKAPKGPATA